MTTGRSVKLRRGMRDKMVAGVRRGRDMAVIFQPAQHRLLVFDFDIKGVGKGNQRAFARIMTAPENRVAQQHVVGDTQTAQDLRPERGFGMVEREFEFGNAQHVLFSIRCQ